MGKRSRSKVRTEPSAGEVGPRQPCPCGSGKRYKACHGAPGGAAATYVARPFEGMPGECDVIAMRELVPAATAPLQVSGTDRSVQLCTLLPGAAPAMVRETGDIWLGLQIVAQYGDPARDLGAVLEQALATTEPGAISLTEDPGEGPRLQDLVTGDDLTVTVHDGFGYWLADADADNEMLAAAIEQADESVHPTSRLTGVGAAYWTNVGPKEHLRWVMPEPEDRLLDALSRLHVSGQDVLVPDSRLVGMFRAHGLLCPVWDLEVGTGAEALEDPAEEFLSALQEALADDTPLDQAQRAARSGLANRQVTIR